MKDLADLPNSPSCERNKDAILKKLDQHLSVTTSVLEIGGGTGQHAQYFASAMPHLSWQTTDRAVYLENLATRIQYADLDNLPAPIALDVSQPWSNFDLRYDGIFTANTLHIMGWEEVVGMVAWLPKVLAPKARVITYGPFNYGGEYTSESNRRFDQSLRQQEPSMGIRDFDRLETLMNQQGIELFEDCEMAANNRLLIWDRT